MGNRVVLLLAVLGMQIAGYLTLAHLHVFALVCGGVHGCDLVAGHPLAHGFGIPALSGIPTAAFGLAAYGLLAGLSAARALARRPGAAWGLAVAQWTLAGGALAVSLWLTFAEAFVIHGWCLWCLLSQGVAAGIFFTLSGEMLLRARQGWPAPGSFFTAPRVTVLMAAMLVLDGVALAALRRVPPVAVPPPPAPRPSALLLPGTPVLGDRNAPYTLVEFGDYACPHCQEADPLVWGAVTHHHLLRAVFYYCPVVDGPHALAARAAQAAARQGCFWPMHTRLMAQAAAGAVTNAWVNITAAQLGCARARFTRDLDSPTVRQMLERQRALADTLEIDAVPAFYLIDPAGRVTALPGLDALEKRLPRGR